MNFDYSFLRENEDKLIRDLIESNPSYYDPNGEDPLILDKNGRPLTKEEIMA